MPDLPEGQVTFVAGSALSPSGWALGKAPAAQAELVADILLAHGAVTFNSEADLLWAFDDARAALEGCAAVVRSVQDHQSDVLPMAIRWGVHTGPAVPNGVGYSAPAPRQAVRLAAAAHPGQIVCSSVTAALANDDLDPSLWLVQLGDWRILDFEGPQRLFQLGGPGLKRDFASLEAVPGSAHNLPIDDSSFVGRGRELDDLADLLESNRVVTVVGPGGVGKTRVAFELTSRFAPRFPDGARVVRLANLEEPAQLVARVAEVMEVQEEAGVALKDTLLTALANRTALLVLDNCEHLGDEPASFVNAVVAKATHIRVLATSRRPLGSLQETIFSLGTLEVPTPGLSTDALSDVPAVQLFLDRARIAVGGAITDEAFVASAGEICRYLDGLPLAIELAAARASLTGIAALAEELGNTLGSLSSAQSSVETRQQTLSALIDWSYGMLTSDERRVFARLSVFRGPFDLSDAQKICSFAPIVPKAIEAVLGVLVRDSLLMVEPDGRFRMLTVIREMAADHLNALGEVAMVRDAHLGVFARAVEPTPSKLAGEMQGEWIVRLDAEIDNIRAALHWGLWGQGDVNVAADLGAALESYWIRRGLRAEGRVWLEGLLARAAGPHRLGALVVAGRLAHEMADYAMARGLLEESISLSDELGEHRRGAHGRGWLGVVNWYQADYEAAFANLEAALSISRSYDDLNGESLWHCALGAVAGSRGEFETAAGHYREALALARSTGDRWIKCVARGNLGDVAASCGEYSTASANMQAAIDIAREVGDRSTEGHWLANLGIVACCQGDYHTATRHIAEGVAIARSVGDRVREAIWLTALAEVALAQHDDLQALSLARQALEVSAQVATARARAILSLVASRQGDREGARREAAAALSALSPDRWERSTALALLAASLGGESAVRLGASLAALETQPASPLGLPHSDWLEETLCQARADLGDAMFDDLWAEGAAHPPSVVADTVLRALGGAGD